MRRIAGSFLILAAFSGCAEDRLAQGDWAPGTRMGRTTVAGSSWPRDDVAQLPAGQGSDMSGWRTGGTGVVIGPQGPAPAYQGAVQTAAKPPAPFPAGYPATGAPMPAAPEPAAPPSGVVPASLNVPGVDPVLGNGAVAGDAAALKQMQGGAPSGVLESAMQTPGRMPEVAMDPKQTPVSVAIDSHVSAVNIPSLRLVNTKRFSLSFTVQDNGSGVATVDLWETRDGKAWKKCEHMHTQQGACVVEVKEEGVFGYAMVARTTGDKSNTQPKAGDVPQVWVTVDTTKPAVALTGVELNLTSRVPNLIVRWSAKDRNFGPRPVSLAYAESADGPWLPLAANVENTGRFECPIPANMPKRAFLRIEAVDLVGNCGLAQTERSVRLDFTAATTNVLPPPPVNQVTADLVRPVVIINCVEPSSGAKD